MDSRTFVIVLAAGLGSRFRCLPHKLLQSLGPSCVLGETLEHVLVCRLPFVVVTSEPLVELVQRYVAMRDVIVLPSSGISNSENPGMGSSIAAGVAARPQASGWVILPGDMPLIRPSTLLAVASQLAYHSVVYAQYNGQRGHPVGFAAELYSELVMLMGDQGARRLIARYPAQGVDIDDPGALMDVDTEADLNQVRAIAHSSFTSSIL